MLNWLFLMRRLSSSSDFSGASEPELRSSLFDQPLSAICSDNDTLPRPIQVGAHSRVDLLRFPASCEKSSGNLNGTLNAKLVGANL